MITSLSGTGLEITRLISSSGPLTKKISLAEDGRLLSDGSACLMTFGRAQRACFPDVQGFAAQLQDLRTNEAIALGALAPALPDEVRVVTKDRLAAMNGSAPADIIARTTGNIVYRPGLPALDVTPVVSSTWS